VAYREIAETVVHGAADENTLPAVRAPLADVPELVREMQALLESRSLRDEYEVDVRGDIVAVVPRTPS
jgi:NADPH-dependent ferric siderophore reductase